MRQDNRRYDELRPIEIIPNFTRFSEGSVLISMGNTKVICTASVQNTIPHWLEKKSIHSGWITSEYSMLPGSTQTRTSREVNRQSGRTQEISRLIGRSLRASVDLTKLGKRTIIIDCDVIQADGGTRTASISGGFVALSIAIKKLINTGEIEKSISINHIAAISAGIVSGHPLLDLCYEEDSQADVDGNFVMSSENKFIEIQISGERFTFTKNEYNKLISLAKKGIQELIAIQKSILEAI
jgi:ribonuclease PH